MNNTQNKLTSRSTALRGLGLIASSLLICACTVYKIVETIPGFEVSINDVYPTTITTVKRPDGIALFDKDYHTSFGDYQSTNIWIKNNFRSKGSKKGSSVSSRFLGNLLILGRLRPELTSVKKYHVVRSRQFSYELLGADKRLVMTGDCELQEILDVEEESSFLSIGKKLEDDIEKRLVGNRVACLINHDGREWVLSVDVDRPKPPVIVLESEEDYYRFEQPVEFNQQLKSLGGKDKINTLKAFNKYVGSQIYFGKKIMVGELHIDYKRGQIVVRNDLPQSEKDLLIGANYGLILSSFINSNWLNKEIEDISN